MTKKKTARKHKLPVVLFISSAALFLASFAIFMVLLRANNLLPRAVQAGSSYQSWQVFDGGKDDPGSNYKEPYLTTSNVSGLRLLWQNTTPATADDSVAYQANVDVNGTYKNLVFVNTIKGNLVAYDALSGQKVWQANPSSADFNGQGTKSSPAVDPSGKYVYAYAVDGYVHKYNIATGAQITGGGFPAQATLLPNNIEKGSASINIANGYLYMTMSGNDGDYGHYDGHVIAVNLSTGAKTVWNAECSNITTLETDSSGASNYCSNTMSGIWARPGVKVDPVTGNVYVTTGNGNYNASSGGNNWGDSIVELSANLTTIKDSYTPSSYSTLDSSDADLGSSGPVILPTVSSSSTPYMMVQIGKDRVLKLLNRANLSGQGGPRHIGGELQTISFSNEVHEQPAVWVDGSNNIWVFVTDDGGNLSAYKLVTSGGTSKLSLVYQKSIGVSSSPFVANGVVYLDGNNIMALNATTGATLFNSSSLGISLNQHWEAPVVINGALYTTSYSGHIYALYLPNVTPTSAPAGSGTSTSTSGSGTSSGSTSTTSSSGAATPSGTSTKKTAKKTTSKQKTASKTSAQVQQATTSLSLTITDAHGKPVAKAKVVLNNGNVAYTDATGKVVFSGLTLGAYTIQVEAPGEKPYSTTVTLGSSQTKDLKVTLASATSRGAVIYIVTGAAVLLLGSGFGYIRFIRPRLRRPFTPTMPGGM